MTPGNTNKWCNSLICNGYTAAGCDECGHTLVEQFVENVQFVYQIARGAVSFIPVYLPHPSECMHPFQWQFKWIWLGPPLAPAHYHLYVLHMWYWLLQSYSIPSSCSHTVSVSPHNIKHTLFSTKSRWSTQWKTYHSSVHPSCWSHLGWPICSRIVSFPHLSIEV